MISGKAGQAKTVAANVEVSILDFPNPAPKPASPAPKQELCANNDLVITPEMKRELSDIMTKFIANGLVSEKAFKEQYENDFRWERKYAIGVDLATDRNNRPKLPRFDKLVFYHSAGSRCEAGVRAIEVLGGAGGDILSWKKGVALRIFLKEVPWIDSREDHVEADLVGNNQRLTVYVSAAEAEMTGGGISVMAYCDLGI